MLRLILLALLSISAVRGDAWSRKSYAEARIDALDARIEQLIHEIESLEHSVEDHEDYDAHVHDLEHRLEIIEGTDCHEHEFSCGRKSGQCISDLLVCDGTPDCENGHDEDHEHVCHNQVPVGRSWSGMAHWKGCLTRHENHMSVLITNNEHNEAFSERLFVDAVVIETWTEDHHLRTETHATHGYYNFANSHLELDAPKDSEKGIGLSCVDAGEGVADCHFVRESDNHICGHALLTRSH